MGQHASGSSLSITEKKPNFLVAGTNSEYQFGIGASKFTALQEATLFANENIVKVACGPNFTFVLTDENVLYGTGSNIYGVLGLGPQHHENQTGFIRIPISFHIQNIYCCRSMAVIVSDGYSVVNSSSSSSEDIAGGNASSMTVNNERFTAQPPRQMFYWSGGELSVSGSPIVNQFSPIVDWNLTIKEQVKFMDAHPTSTFFIIVTESNKIYFSGVNGSGQFGNGEERRSFKSLYFLPPALFPSYNGVRMVACGANHTVIVTDNHELYTSGNNKFYQLGHSNATSTNTFQKPNVNFQGQSIRMVKCGENFTIVYLENGDLYACGNNSYGQLMNGKFHEKITFHKVLSHKNIVSLNCGDNFTVFISSDFKIHRAGCNSHGELFTEGSSQSFSSKIISSSVNRSYKLFGISCSKGYVILYRQYGNYFGEVLFHPKWKYYSFVVRAPRRAKPLVSPPRQQRHDNKPSNAAVVSAPPPPLLVFIPSNQENFHRYLMYRSIHDHFHLMKQEIIPFLKNSEQEEENIGKKLFSDISILLFQPIQQDSSMND
ncbi:hypothetical protein C9374_012835 [Naegleria lovaniensis]|uniref:RCC1-like domain-containing protein n=1 Tax=Naegleria lovaniensis TaxID=51637 RepID=A0AA88GCS7_NAELO|nr:uncharacterized protein C9374_012835 [Naegleria lovaniensis]KAG2373103.1 hypothetical protein C9374_012835 [Naegleria lovaniensis]